MHGHLTARSAADLCRGLAEADATGVLHVTGPETAGSISFEGGRLVAASSPTPGARLGDRLVGAGLLEEEDLDRVLHEQAEAEGDDRPRLGRLLVDRGLVPQHAVRLVIQEQLIDAVFDLTRWRDGTYRFDGDAPTDTPEVPLQMHVEQVLIEVARRREEWEAVLEIIGDVDAVPRFREGASSSSAALEPDEFAVLASVDGDRSVRDLAHDLGFGEFEAARLVYALHLLGLVEVTPRVDEIGAALDDALSFAEQPSPPPEPEADDVVDHDVPADDTPADEAPAEPATLEAELPDLSAFEDASEPDDLSAFEDAEDASVGQEPTPDASAAADGSWAPSEPEPRPAEEAPPPPPVDEPTPWVSPPEDEPDTAPAGRDEPPTWVDPTEDETAPGAAPAPSGDVPSASSGDVSEFLRELSRLALDDDGGDDEDDEEPGPSGGRDTAPPPRPRPPRPREEPKRKKRGLFGFGG